MNGTQKEATLKRYHYGTHDQFKKYLPDFVDAYNYTPRLKTISGLTPCEYICKMLGMPRYGVMPSLNVVSSNRWVSP